MFPAVCGGRAPQIMINLASWLTRWQAKDANSCSRQDLVTKAQVWLTNAGEEEKKRGNRGKKTTKIIPKRVVHNTQWRLLKTARAKLF